MNFHNNNNEKEKRKIEMKKNIEIREKKLKEENNDQYNVYKK